MGSIWDTSIYKSFRDHVESPFFQSAQDRGLEYTWRGAVIGGDLDRINEFLENGQDIEERTGGRLGGMTLIFGVFVCKTKGLKLVL